MYLLITFLFTLSLGIIETSEAQISKAPCPCKVPKYTSNGVALGIPKVDGYAPTIGEVNMAVLFVDFDDVPAKRIPDSVFSIINPIAADFFK